jgi:hypothetical protein
MLIRCRSCSEQFVRGKAICIRRRKEEEKGLRRLQRRFK